MLPCPNQTRPSLPSPPVNHGSAEGKDKLTSAHVQPRWQLLGRGGDAPDPSRTQGCRTEELGWGTSLHLPSKHTAALTHPAQGVLLSETKQLCCSIACHLRTSPGLPSHMASKFCPFPSFQGPSRVECPWSQPLINPGKCQAQHTAALWEARVRG